MYTSIQASINPIAATKISMISSQRKTTLITGVFYLLTFVSIPTLSLYRSIHEPNYILGDGHDNHVIIGGILEIIVALSGIATAVVLFPVLKKQNKAMALGLVVSRLLEASTMFTGVAFLLAVITLRQTHAGIEALPVSHALVALYDRIFLLGQSFMPAVNDLLLGFLLYKSRLVPRFLTFIGIAGALPLIAGYLAVLFGFIGLHSILAGLAALLVALFEFSLGIYLIVKGFKSSPGTTEN
jgi:hypothetical protein